jgi:hypothetical protein
MLQKWGLVLKSFGKIYQVSASFEFGVEAAVEL